MSGVYYNYRSSTAESWLDRTSFAWNWWRIYARDPYWVPPYYPLFRREIETQHNDHLARLDPIYISFEALIRSPSSQSRRRETFDEGAGPPVTGGSFEQPVAAAILLKDPRRSDGSAYVSLLHCENDMESLERLLSRAADLAGSSGLIGPVGLSPFLESGLLLDHWNQVPPLHTAYHPPYLPEIAGTLAEPSQTSRLYEIEISSLPAIDAHPHAVIDPLTVSRLAGDLLPVFTGCLSDRGGFPPIDAQEAAFLLRWISIWPVQACLASMDGQPVGFILLGPDLAPHLQRAKGGRNIIRRAWLRRKRRLTASQGRIFFGGVLPGWRGQGIGRQLLRHAAVVAREACWEKLAIGPVPEASPSARFLAREGALACQTYGLYRWEL